MQSVPKPKKPAEQANFIGLNLFQKKEEKPLPEQGTWHQERKKAILAKYPEIKELCKPEWKVTVPITWMYLAAHLSVSYLVSKYDVSGLTVFVLSYTFGCWFAFVLQACGHEGVHGNVFKNYALNRLHGYIAFLPLWFMPFETFWQPEHLHHHTIVVDKALRFGHRKNRLWVKLVVPFLAPILGHIWLSIQSVILFITCCVSVMMYAIGLKSNPLPKGYAVKPFSQFPSMISWGYMVLCIISSIFWYNWYTAFGFKAVAYLILGSIWSNGFSPFGMRNVQEHLVKVKNQPTYSMYYSEGLIWLHYFLGLNINFHMEHHDFSNIPSHRLPRLRKIAPEFYENMNNYHSYTQVWKEFLFNDGIPPAAFFDETIFPSGGSSSDQIDSKKAQ